MEPDYLLQGFEVGEEGFPAEVGNFIGCDRFPSRKAFMDADIGQVFQLPEVAGQIAVGQLEGILQVVEGDPVVDSQDGHDAQPNLAVKGFVELSDDIFHLLEFLDSRSCA